MPHDWAHVVAPTTVGKSECLEPFCTTNYPLLAPDQGHREQRPARSTPITTANELWSAERTEDNTPQRARFGRALSHPLY